MIGRVYGICVLLLTVPLCSFPAYANHLQWQNLPDIPEPLSGHAVGVHNGAIVIAGGTDFPVSPFQGGTKLWRDGVFVLADSDSQWVMQGVLPAARAYAAVVSHSSGVYIIGGANANTHYSDTLRLEIKDGTCSVHENALPPLPNALAYAGAGLIGDTLYVVGGQSSPNLPQASDEVWKINLASLEKEWLAVPPLPGGGVFLPVVCAAGDLYVFSGARLFENADGKVDRNFLTTSWQLKAGEWIAVAETPVPFVAAPGLRLGEQDFIVIFGGDNGAYFTRNEELGDTHPGFPKAVWAYHPITDSWAQWGESPVGYVSTGAVEWEITQGENGKNKAFAVVGGEDRPGHRGTKTVAATLVNSGSRLGYLDHAVLIVYFALLVAIGYYFSRTESSTETFFLGGRKVPWWAVGISIFGTSLSAITYLSIPATAYSGNWVFVLANIGIVFVAPVVVYFYIPKYRRSPITTAYEYLEQRFNLPIRIYGSLCFMAFQSVRVGIVLLLPAMALNAATGINVYYCIVAMGVLATLYTVMGGIEAVIWTDVLQAIVLVLCAIFSLGLVVWKIDGGAYAVYQLAEEADKFHTFTWSWDYTIPAVWVVLLGNAFANLYPYTADQTIVQRFLTTKDDKSAAKAVWVNAALTIPITLLFFSIGTSLWAYFKMHPAMLDPTLKIDATLPLFVMHNFPDGLKGLLIAAIFAASMSSLDSSINSFASVITTDYYKRFLPNASDQSALTLAKIVTLLAGAFGTGVASIMAGLNNTTLFQPFLEMLGLVGGGLAGIFALGVFTKRGNGSGAVVGVLASASILYYTKQYTDVYPHLYGLIGFISAMLIGYAASFAFSGNRNNYPKSLVSK